MNKIIITMLGIFLISNVIGMYAGDSYSFQTNLTNPIYTVTGNSSNLEGLNITYENGNITISPVINYKPDSFTLIFLDNQSYEVIKTVSVGSGSSGGTRTITKNVTTYVPVHINDTVEVEVEKIVPIDNTTVLEKDIPVKTIFVILAIGIIIGIWSYNYWIKKDEPKTIEEDLDIKPEDMIKKYHKP